jgi:hypothetical protein
LSLPIFLVRPLFARPHCHARTVRNNTCGLIFDWSSVKEWGAGSTGCGQSRYRAETTYPRANSPTYSQWFMPRLESCPDTKQSFSAACRISMQTATILKLLLMQAGRIVKPASRLSQLGIGTLARTAPRFGASASPLTNMCSVSNYTDLLVISSSAVCVLRSQSIRLETSASNCWNKSFAPCRSSLRPISSSIRAF